MVELERNNNPETSFLPMPTQYLIAYVRHVPDQDTTFPSSLGLQLRISAAVSLLYYFSVCLS